ncbi:MAG TPA: methyltransferase domain-containing protein [Bacteroidetes bacterium]|nr:methyltransferase domain-containing protein [Bacteroidota bacterium]
MDYFDFKQFRLYQKKPAFRIGTDGVLLGAWADVSYAAKILDIGTGTGLIALMMAQRTSAEIVAIEADSHSYEQAVENIEISPWQNRIEVINERIQDHSPGETYDLIVTNPPFFRQSLANRDERLARARHDYDLSGTDLLLAVKRFMAPGGRFCLILPYREAAIFIAEAVGFGLYCNKIIKVKPLPSAPVKRMLMEFGTEKKELLQSFLTIEKARHKYTDEYKKLTADFYLAF